MIWVLHLYEGKQRFNFWTRKAAWDAAAKFGQVGEVTGIVVGGAHGGDVLGHISSESVN